MESTTPQTHQVPMGQHQETPENHIKSLTSTINALANTHGNHNTIASLTSTINTLANTIAQLDQNNLRLKYSASSRNQPWEVNRNRNRLRYSYPESQKHRPENNIQNQWREHQIESRYSYPESQRHRPDSHILKQRQNHWIESEQSTRLAMHHPENPHNSYSTAHHVIKTLPDKDPIGETHHPSNSQNQPHIVQESTSNTENPTTNITKAKISEIKSSRLTQTDTIHLNATDAQEIPTMANTITSSTITTEGNRSHNRRKPTEGNQLESGHVKRIENQEHQAKIQQVKGNLGHVSEHQQDFLHLVRPKKPPDHSTSNPHH